MAARAKPRGSLLARYPPSLGHGSGEALRVPDCFFRPILPTTTLQIWRSYVREKLQPSKKWPNAVNGRMRSQTIFVIASIGTDGITPGTPHIQNQKTRETITRTGLSVNV
jgi:hypothetical protein